MTNNDKTKTITIELDSEMIDAFEWALEYAIEMSIDDLTDLSTVRMTKTEIEEIHARHLAFLRMMNLVNPKSGANFYECTINHYRQNEGRI